jgi:hypothetical protein
LCAWRGKHRWRRSDAQVVTQQQQPACMARACLSKKDFSWPDIMPKL